MKNRFVSSTVDLGKGFAWLLYDLQKREIVKILCDYADEMIHRAQLKRLTVDKEMGHLRIFWAYMNAHGIKLDSITDETLMEFRKYALDAVIAGPAYRRELDSAHRTVNEKLIRIYDWLVWLRERGDIESFAVGSENCRVTSALETSKIHERKKRNRSLSSKTRYPLLLPIQAGASKHALSRFVPTEQTMDLVYEYFHNNSKSEYVAHRNCAITAIASYQGFRRASIQSLTTSQFVCKENDAECRDECEFVKTKNDTYLIQPSRQKGGYGNEFEVPKWLHDQIRDFIVRYRNPRIKKLGVGAKIHQFRIFISDRDGRPLTDGSMTALMSKAMRAVGAPKGTALHAWRTKYAVEETAAEYESRREMKLDTSIGTMDEVIARKLGQRNPKSHRAYTSAYEGAEVSRKRAQRENERHADKRRIKELEDELARLKQDKEGKPIDDPLGNAVPPNSL